MDLIAAISMSTTSIFTTSMSKTLGDSAATGGRCIIRS